MLITLNIDPRFTEGKTDRLSCEYADVADLYEALKAMVEEIEADFGTEDAPAWSPLKRRAAERDMSLRPRPGETPAAVIGRVTEAARS